MRFSQIGPFLLSGPQRRKMDALQVAALTVCPGCLISATVFFYCPSGHELCMACKGLPNARCAVVACGQYMPGLKFLQLLNRFYLTYLLLGTPMAGAACSAVSVWGPSGVIARRLNEVLAVVSAESGVLSAAALDRIRAAATCEICMEPRDHFVVCVLGHSICRRCVRSASSCCPLCREPFGAWECAASAACRC